MGSLVYVAAYLYFPSSNAHYLNFRFMVESQRKKLSNLLSKLKKKLLRTKKKNLILWHSLMKLTLLMLLA